MKRFRLDQQMDIWVNGQMDRIDGYMGRWVEQKFRLGLLMDQQMDRWIDGQNRWVYGQMGRIEIQTGMLMDQQISFGVATESTFD